MKKLIGAVIVVALLGTGFLVFRAGWLGRWMPGAGTPEATRPPVSGVGGGVGGSAAGEAKAGGGTVATAGGVDGTAGSGPGEAPGEPPLLAVETLAPGGNIALLDAGAFIESATSEFNLDSSAMNVLDGKAETLWWSSDTRFPQDIVVSFFNRQPALISAVAVNPGRRGAERQLARDVEVWVSMTSPTEGFTKIGALTLRQETVDQALDFAPVEARFVKLRILSNHGDKFFVQCGDLKVIEAQRAGYTPLLARNPEVVALGTGRLPAVPAAMAGSALDAAGRCTTVSSGPALAPSSSESRNVLVLSPSGAQVYTPIAYKPTDTAGGLDYSIYGRIKFVILQPQFARAAQLAKGFDTVVLAQVCKIRDEVSGPFKRALAAWVAQGHKLIIQDSDECGGSPGPDYNFLPFPFVTSNPGAQGAKGPGLLFVEENHLVNNRPGDPAFLDVESWLASRNGSFNEIGDSNTVYKYDAHWCGQLYGANALKVNGFMLAYAHYGRGLIVYDGFDEDQRDGVAYRQLVTRELALGFDPDGLPCSARLGDFVITTEERFKVQPMVPGRTYIYPLKLLSNQGYKGTVNLTLSPTPAEPGLTGTFEPATLRLDDISKAALTVTAARTASPAPHVLTVRGTDASGKSNALCLQLTERTTGGIQVVSELQRDRKPTRNLEIILDVSGSMKTALGKKTRWATALDVLEQVLQKLPDDFHVGLRLYGHREPSTSPKTCTDTELVVPIGKLNRPQILGAARAWKPKGETPLVYSVLQTPADLKAAGGGTVILITDGEESCKGDVKSAAQQIRASGLDVAVNIVGFTLTGKQTAAQLTTLAEGTGGHYYAAQSGEALARALLIAAVEKFPYVITDAVGKAVAKGEAGGPPEELPAGEYTVAVTAGDQQLTEKVTVAIGSDVTLRVRLNGDKFVVVR